MGKSFQVNGESLVTIRFGAHMYPNAPPPPFTRIPAPVQLGLTSDSISITPRYVHNDISADDYGGKIPAEISCSIADASINMTLVVYDNTVLDACLAESMGGTAYQVLPTAQNIFNIPGVSYYAGAMSPAGSLLGNGLPLLSSGNHFMSLNILSPQQNYPWRFPSAYLTGPPVKIPLGTERSLVSLNWRAIPYASPMVFTNQGAFLRTQEIVSSGTILWDHQLQT